MAYGLRLYDSTGAVTFDSNSFSVRMVYRAQVTTSSSASTVITVPNFDGSKGVVWFDFGTSQPSSQVEPNYTISGSTVTVLPYANPTGGLFINAVQFS